MREIGPASITPSGVPADRRDAAALALEARSPATRRAYRAALARIEETLAGRALPTRRWPNTLPSSPPMAWHPPASPRPSPLRVSSPRSPAGRTRADP